MINNDNNKYWTEERSDDFLANKFPPSKLEANIDTIKACQKVREILEEDNDYGRGYYNGLETALSILEVRNPEYKRSNISLLITDPDKVKQIIKDLEEPLMAVKQQVSDKAHQMYDLFNKNKNK